MQKSEGMEDPRVRRTRQLLQQAFLACTVEKGFASVTVSDITERAMLNRSTFYRHYLDKYDLLEQYLDDMSTLLEEQEVRVQRLPQEGPSGLVDLLKHIQKEASFYRVMLSEKGDTLFARRFQHKTEKRMLSCFQQVFSNRGGETGALPLELQFSLITSATCGAIVWWLEQEYPCPPEQLATWLTHFVSGAIDASFQGKGPSR